MTQVFGEGDKLLPVTVIEAGPCYVTQVKSQASDGYNAIQVGFGELKESRASKPVKGHLEKAGVGLLRHLAEFRVEDPSEYAVGREITVGDFAAGERANVSGLSKGKGFAGVIKRWGFKGGPGGHGSHFHRAPGSIGMAATPSRVPKGRKLPGRHGNEVNTIKNLEIVQVDTDKNIILLKGAVPGHRGSLVMIEKVIKAAKAK